MEATANLGCMGSGNSLPSDGEAEARAEVEVMKRLLHNAGVRTAGLTDAQVREKHGEWSEQRQRELDDAKRRREEESRAALLRETIGRKRSALQRDGIDAAGLDDAQVEAEYQRLEQERLQREKKAAQEKALKERQRRAEALLLAAKAPLRHLLELDEINATAAENAANHPRWTEVRNLLADNLTGVGYLIALLGKRGPGKTQIAVSVIQSACQAGLGARYIKAQDLFREIRRSYTPVAKGQAGESEIDVIDDLVGYHLLVIDELHERGETKWEQSTLINLLDRRYDALRCTILIANQTKAEFAESMGDSVISRIHETGEAIVCDWPSFRVPGSWRANRKETQGE